MDIPWIKRTGVLLPSATLQRLGGALSRKRSDIR